jgi:hypothetical protein
MHLELQSREQFFGQVMPTSNIGERLSKKLDSNILGEGEGWRE